MCCIPHYGVLPDRAVLILINDEPRIVRCEDVVHVTCLEQLGRGDSDVGIVGARIRQVQQLGLVRAPHRKCRDEPHGPSVNRREAISFGGHACAV